MPNDTGPAPHDALAADLTFAVVPTWVLSRAPSRAVHLYAILRRYADQGGAAWPSRATLAKRLGCSPDTVDRSLRDLRRIGAVTIEHRWTDAGVPTSNLYRLHAQPGDGPVDGEGGVAATVRPGSRNRAAGVAAPVRHEREPLNESQGRETPLPPVDVSEPPGRAARSGRPPWCREDECDERTRLRDGAAGVTRCPLCHPAVAGRL